MSTIERSSDLTVREVGNGRTLVVRGAGALKGRLKLDESIDLTKPIASQAVKPVRRRKVIAAD